MKKRWKTWLKGCDWRGSNRVKGFECENENEEEKKGSGFRDWVNLNHKWPTRGKQPVGWSWKSNHVEKFQNLRATQSPTRGLRINYFENYSMRAVDHNNLLKFSSSPKQTKSNTIVTNLIVQFLYVAIRNYKIINKFSYNSIFYN